VFWNRDGDLPIKPIGYYHEYDLVTPTPDGRGKLRLVLGGSGEVYITGNHYDDFRQVINMPE
jgi:ribonuclease T1